MFVILNKYYDLNSLTSLLYYFQKTVTISGSTLSILRYHDIYSYKFKIRNILPKRILIPGRQYLKERQLVCISFLYGRIIHLIKLNSNNIKRQLD